jgi:hypothetical protein
MRQLMRVLAVFLFLLLATPTKLLLGGPPQNTVRPLGGYTHLLLEKMTVEKFEGTKGFPEGMQTKVQEHLLKELQKPLRKLKFEEVSLLTEGAETPEAQTSAASPQAKALTLSGTIIEYHKGSRAARHLVGGFGAGKASLKIRFIFRDAATHEEVYRTEVVGTCSGGYTWELGGGAGRVAADTARSVALKLVRDISKNRY